MSSTQCKDTKSYEHANGHTTGRNILTENYHTQENADSIKLQIYLVSDILLGFISLLIVDEVIYYTGTRIPDPPFSSFGPSRDYGMDLCLEVYL